MYPCSIFCPQKSPILNCSPSQLHAINEIALTTLLLHALYPQHFTFQWKLLVYIMFFGLPRKTIKLQMYTHSDSFRCAKQRKGGRVRSFGGLQSTKKVSTLSSKNLRNFFPRVVFFPNETWYMLLSTWPKSYCFQCGCISFYVQTTVSVSVL